MKQIWAATAALGALMLAAPAAAQMDEVPNVRITLPAGAEATGSEGVEIIRADTLGGVSTVARPRIIEIAPEPVAEKSVSRGDTLLGAAAAAAGAIMRVAAAPFTAHSERASAASDESQGDGADVEVIRGDALGGTAIPGDVKPGAAALAGADAAPAGDAAAAPGSAAMQAISTAPAISTMARGPMTVRTDDIGGVVLQALACATGGGAGCGASAAMTPGMELISQPSARGGTLQEQRMAELFRAQMAHTWSEDQQRAIVMLGYYSAAATMCDGASLDPDQVAALVQANFAAEPGASAEELRRRHDALTMHIGMAAGLAMGAHVENVPAFCAEAAANRHNFAAPLLRPIATDPPADPPAALPEDPPALPAPLAAR